MPQSVGKPARSGRWSVDVWTAAIEQHCDDRLRSAYPLPKQTTFMGDKLSSTIIETCRYAALSAAIYVGKKCGEQRAFEDL